MTILNQILTIVKYIAAVGILAHVAGEALPRQWFHWERFPYRAWAWEREGKAYEALGIRWWKDRLPDKSKHTKRTFTKQMQGHQGRDSLLRFVQETCVAECVHWILIFLSLPLYTFVPTPLGLVVTVIYALSNLPFILIQRYNRPRLIRILQRKPASGREQEIQAKTK